MYETIQVNDVLIDDLKSKVLEGYPLKQNYRLPRNFNTKIMASYKVYKHIDISRKDECPTNRLLKSFYDSNYQRKMSKIEYIDYQKLINESLSRLAIYSSTYRNFMKNESISVERTVSQKEVKYTHMAELKQQVSHVHKVNAKLIRNIFGMNISDVKYGQQSKLTVVSKDGVKNDLDIVYLGGDKYDYMKNARQSNQSVKTQFANKIIAKQDAYYAKTKDYDKMIGKVRIDVDGFYKPTK